MKIVTWNLQHGSVPRWRQQFDYLRHELRANLAFLQETYNPNLLRASGEPCAVFRCCTGADGKNLSWGSAIWSRSLPLEELPLDTYLDQSMFRGRAVAATVMLRPGMSMTVICVHVPTSKNAQAAAAEIFKGLAPLLTANIPVIFAGDLNLTVHDKRPLGQSDIWMRDRLVTEFGLVNCTKYITDRARLCQNEVSTLRGYPNQIDYIFASRTFEIHSFDVLEDTEMSDHWPVVADVTLPA
jgi:endonuclease/exonuclease/phosphatase family metal-dependent hydrolase